MTGEQRQALIELRHDETAPINVRDAARASLYYFEYGGQPPADIASIITAYVATRGAQSRFGN